MYNIKVILSDKIFIRFAFFDAFVRQKRWKLLVGFSLIMLAFSFVAYFYSPIEADSTVLVIVLILVALIIPLVYIYQFYLSLKKQCKAMGLSNERYVYTLKFENSKIVVEDEKDSICYDLNTISNIYIDKECIYLFISQKRAYLIPTSCINKTDNSFIDYINKNLIDKTKLKYVRGIL